MKYLIGLNNDSFEVSNESQLCDIFDISVQLYELFKRPRKIKMERECKIELLQWIKQGYIETDNSLFTKTVTPPTFLEIMKKASLVNNKD